MLIHSNDVQFETNIESFYIVMVWLDKVQDLTLTESDTRGVYGFNHCKTHCTIPRSYLNKCQVFQNILHLQLRLLHFWPAFLQDGYAVQSSLKIWSLVIGGRGGKGNRVLTVASKQLALERGILLLEFCVVLRRAICLSVTAEGT